MLISTLLGKGVGATGKPGHFRTLFPFSVSGKTVVGLLLRRRPLYPTELRVHGCLDGNGLIISGNREFVNEGKTEKSNYSGGRLDQR